MTNLFCQPFFLQVLILVHLVFSVVMAAGIHYTPDDAEVRLMPEGPEKDAAMKVLLDSREPPELLKTLKFMKSYDFIRTLSLNAPWMVSLLVCVLQLFALYNLKTTSACGPKSM